MRHHFHSVQLIVPVRYIERNICKSFLFLELCNPADYFSIFMQWSYKAHNLQIQSLVIEILEDSFTGMPFVLRSDGNWIKNKGSDFYIEFGIGPKQVQKVAVPCLYLCLLVISLSRPFVDSMPGFIYYAYLMGTFSH